MYADTSYVTPAFTVTVDRLLHWNANGPTFATSAMSTDVRCVPENAARPMDSTVSGTVNVPATPAGK